MLVVALRATVLGVRSSTYDPQVTLQPAQEALDLLLLLAGFISNILSARKASRSCTMSDCSRSAMKLPASSLGRQASTRGQNIGVLALGVELLPGLRRALLWRGGGSRDAAEYSSYKKYFTFLR